MNPAFVKSPVHDIFFDLLDGYRRLIDAEYAGGLTRCWTNPAGEFREVVGCMQLPHCFLPTSVINQIVPIGNQIVDGTSRLTKGHAAIHAARALSAKIRFGEIEVDFEPVVDALSDRTPGSMFPRVFQEAGVLTHAAPAPPGPWRQRADLECTAVAGGSLRALACARGGKF